MLRRLSRLAGLVSTTALGAAVLAGCVPSDPISAPLAMTVVNGVPTYAWCGGRTSPLHYMSIEYRTFDPDSETIASAEGVGEFILSRDLQFSTVDPPGGLEFTVKSEIPVDHQAIRVFVYAGAGPNSTSLMSSFDSDGLAELDGHAWLQATGELTDEPCYE